MVKTITQNNALKVIAGEGNKFEIIGRTYSHQGAPYYMTEYINHYYFDQDAIQFNGSKNNVILSMPVQVEILREEKRPKGKLITLKARYLWLYASYLLRDLAVAAGQLKII